MPNLYIKWIREVDLEDSSIIGLDFAKLGKLQKENFNISPSFIITPLVFFDFLKTSKLPLKIQHLYKTIDFNNPKSISQTAKHMQDLILKSALNEKLIKEIITAYRKLNQIEDEDTNIYVCINGKEKQVFSNIKGDAVVIEKIKDCFAHIYNEKLLLQSHKNNMPLTSVDVSVLIQKVIKQDFSGTIHTVKTDPYDKSKLVVYIKNEDIYFEVDKTTLKILDNSNNQSLISKDLVSQIAKVGIDLEKQFYFPQTISWFSSENIIYIENFKEITNTNQPKGNLGKSLFPILGKPIQKGIVSGPIKMINTLKDAQKLNAQEIAVITNSNKNITEIINCKGIIILENELDKKSLPILENFKIPCVAISKDLLKNFKNGHIFTVNGTTGEINIGGSYKNNLVSFNASKTVTKIYKNILTNYDLEDLSIKTASGFVLDGNLLIKKIGIHPKKIISDKKHLEFIDNLGQIIANFCEASYPTPVLYKTSHLTTVEYATLLGGEDFEITESNPILGFRGGLRHTNEKEIFELELRALDKINYSNLELLISFVRTPDEFNTLKTIIYKFQFTKSANFKLWLTADLPSNIIMLNKFIRSGLNGIFLNLSQVNSLMMGYEVENSNYFEKAISTKEITFWILENFIKICQQYNIESVIYDNSLLNKTDILEKAINLGVSGISILPKDIGEIQKLLIYFEKRLLLQ